MKRFLNQLKTTFMEEHERWPLWLPVAFGFGIVVYFLLPVEPPFWFGFILPLLTGILVLLSKRKPFLFYFALLLFFTALGFARIQYQAHWVKAPVLDKIYHNVTIEGRVEKNEFFPSAQRLTLSDLKMSKVPIKLLKVRIRINGLKTIAHKNDIVRLKATLRPPALPAYPGGYAFVRRAWFMQLGATGYSLSEIEILENEKYDFLHEALDKVRRQITLHLMELLPPRQAAVAIPLVVGEQGIAPRQTYDTYRDAGIVHVLSVSGFHMTLIAGLVFAFVRFSLALIPALALRLDTKKISAVLALLVTFLYLLISGQAVPAERSFLMIAVVLLAVLFDRQALSMRNVCWAGFLILLFIPESIMTASFQLSFGAVVALIAGYETFKAPISRFIHKKRSKLSRFLWAAFLGFLLTNIVAHAATAPIGIYHFHRYANYGILGNFLTSSLFGFIIMPLLLIGTLLIPLGLDSFFFKSAGFFLEIVGKIAETVADLPKASVVMPAFSNWGYGLIILGGLWICLWKKKWRLWGAAAIFIGFSTAFFSVSPDVYIAQGGKIFAIRDEKGIFHFSEKRKERYVRSQWMEAAGTDPLTAPKTRRLIDFAYTVKGLSIAFDASTCAKADIAFIREKYPEEPCLAAQVIDRNTLWMKGTHVLYIQNGRYKLENAADSLGSRLWNPLVERGLK